MDGFNRPAHLTEDEHLVVPLTLARHIAIWTLALMILTQLVYPGFYSHLIGFDWLTAPSTLLLALRNIGLLYFSVRLIALAFRSIAFPRKAPAAKAEAPQP